MPTIYLCGYRYDNTSVMGVILYPWFSSLIDTQMSVSTLNVAVNINVLLPNIQDNRIFHAIFPNILKCIFLFILFPFHWDSMTDIQRQY